MFDDFSIIIKTKDVDPRILVAFSFLVFDSVGVTVTFPMDGGPILYEILPYSGRRLT